MPLPITRAAEGLDRLAFSVADLERMIAAGVIDADARLELIGGEITPMSPQFMPHMIFKARLAAALSRSVSDAFDVIPEATLFLDGDTLLEPDIAVVRRDRLRRRLTPDAVALIVEVADTSQARDLGVKPAIYAAAGVPEYWVCDLAERRTVIHRDARDRLWASIDRVGFADTLAPLFEPAMALNMTGFEFEEH